MENAEAQKSETKGEQSKKEVASKSRQYNLLVYVRVRPMLQTEYAKEVAITCNDDVSFPGRI